MRVTFIVLCCITAAVELYIVVGIFRRAANSLYGRFDTEVTTLTELDPWHRQNGFALEPGAQSGFGHYQAQEVRTLAWLKS